MLSFLLHSIETAASWQMDRSGYRCGGSHIHPFRHTALEEVAVQSHGRFLLCVRERCAGLRGPEASVLPVTGGLSQIDEVQFDRLAEELRRWPLQWHLLMCDLKPEASADRVLATLECGVWGSAPVFLHAGDGVLRGDWDASRLLPFVSGKHLDPVRVTRYLAEYAHPYATETMFLELKLLTDRARAVWTGGMAKETLSIIYPQPWKRPPAGELREGADPVAAFDAILAASLQRWTGVADGCLGVEVSGGLDSGIVASATAALAASPVRSYGIAMMGASAEDQVARRAELTERFRLMDTAVPIASFLPLSPDSCRLQGTAPILPWEEGYYEVFDHLLGKAAGNGTRVLLTGFGGDELCGLRPSEIRALRGKNTDPMPAGSCVEDETPGFLTDRARATLHDVIEEAPMGCASASSIECAALSSARYLRHGIWPVHPLCTPELVHFCARLPVPWRRGRRIQRELLARWGCSTLVTHPPILDDFSPALRSALRGPARPLLQRLFADSALHEMGMVDAGRLMRDYSTWCDGGELDHAVRFHAVALTELCLRSMA